ncbi:MAG: hypothetical protein FJ214_03040 [Ignavibacteria bacterium]|nr:hypothetical protein [Ignavibacteria bacterium]
MKKIYFLMIVLFTFYYGIDAQTVSGSIMLGSPQKDFRKNVDRLGYGFQFSGTLWSPGKERPFTIGLNLGYLVYGEINERRPFSITNPDVSVEVSRTNNLANFHVLFQLSPFSGTVRPYAEGLFGGAYIFTTTEIKSEWTQEQIAQSTNYDDFTWSYGAGGGLLILLSRDLGEVSELYLDLKVRYIYGSEATYLTENGVVIDRQNGRVFYNPVRSKTDLMLFHLGVSAFF